MVDCPICQVPMATDRACRSCGWRPDPPVRASVMTLSTPWGLRRRRRSIARAARAVAIVDSSGASTDGGLVRQPTTAEPGGAVHQCSACRGAMSILSL